MSWFICTEMEVWNETAILQTSKDLEASPSRLAVFRPQSSGLVTGQRLYSSHRVQEGDYVMVVPEGATKIPSQLTELFKEAFEANNDESITEIMPCLEFAAAIYKVVRP